MWLGFLFAMAAAAIVGFVVANTLTASRTWALIHDGAGNYTFGPARLKKSGLECGKVTYPLSQAKVVYAGSFFLYLYKFDTEDWEVHKSLDSVRDQMALASIFKPGGDIFDIARLAASLLSFLLIVLLYFSFSSLQHAVVQNALATQSVQAEVGRLVAPEKAKETVTPP